MYTLGVISLRRYTTITVSVLHSTNFHSNLTLAPFCLWFQSAMFVLYPAKL